MTRFKKCDYCKHERSSVKKYKTMFNQFGKGTKSKTDSVGCDLISESSPPDIFWLCDVCFESLIPNDKVLRKNRIDNDFFEDKLRKELGISFKLHEFQNKGQRYGY